MPEKAEGGREIRDFPGLILDADTRDLPEGATNLQINCTSEDRGVLTSRRGYVLVDFEGE